MPFILALFIAVILNPLVQHMVRWRVPRVLAVCRFDDHHRDGDGVAVLIWSSALNELTRTLPTISQLYYDAAASVIEPLLQRVGIDVSVDQLAH